MNKAQYKAALRSSVSRMVLIYLHRSKLKETVFEFFRTLKVPA